MISKPSVTEREGLQRPHIEEPRMLGTPKITGQDQLRFLFQHHISFELIEELIEEVLNERGITSRKPL